MSNWVMSCLGQRRKVTTKLLQSAATEKLVPYTDEPDHVKPDHDEQQKVIDEWIDDADLDNVKQAVRELQHVPCVDASDHDEPDDDKQQKVIDEMIATVRDFDGVREDLKRTLNDLVRPIGWWNEALVVKLLLGLEHLILNLVECGRTFEDLADKAGLSVIGVFSWDKLPGNGKKFSLANRKICAITSLAILYVLNPGVLEILGFEWGGPVKGSIAETWTTIHSEHIDYHALLDWFDNFKHGLRPHPSDWS